MKRRSTILASLSGAFALAAGVAVACASAPTTAATRSLEATTTGPIVTAPQSADAHEAWVKFAACMQHHGAGRVSVLPGPLGGIRIISGLPRNATQAQQQAWNARVHAANAACRYLIRAYQRSSNSSADEAKFRDGMLRFTKCLRAHGINVGDPIIRRVSGGFDVSWPPNPSISQTSARWRTATNACRALNPLVNP